MAFDVDDQVKVNNESSQWRGRTGQVKAVLSGSNYEVRLDGHGCSSRVVFAEGDLAADTRAAPVDYSRC